MAVGFFGYQAQAETLLISWTRRDFWASRFFARASPSPKDLTVHADILLLCWILYLLSGVFRNQIEQMQEKHWEDLLKLVRARPRKKRKIPKTNIKGSKKDRPVQEVYRLAFMRLVKNGDCLDFSGGKDAHGYGFVTLEARQIRAHRFFYVAEYGLPPAGSCICHTCDNTSCCNPAHLFAGTHMDNMRDMSSKNRNNHPVGEKINTARLTSDEVIEIRRLFSIGWTATSICKKFDTKLQNAYCIKYGKTWKHLL